MSAELLISKLDKVKRTGPGRWIACCPAHEDRHPSLNIKETDDGKVLVHCFAGCSFFEIVSAVGIDATDLFPPRQDYGKPDRRPFPAVDVLRAIGFEALVVSASAVTMLSGEPFTQLDRDRLVLASSRIQAAISAAGLGGRYG